jgi:NADP-dependent alcohol dehydrogenase
MLNFEFCNPTKIYFGQGQIVSLSAAIPQDIKTVLLTYGGGSIKKNGIYEQILTALKKRPEIKIIEFNGIEPNPRYETLMKAVAIAKKYHVDFLLAVGGGSVIDGTKFIAAAVPFQENPWNILSQQITINTALPLACILTLPASGSEMNWNAVISKGKNGEEKLSFASPKVFPLFSILDPTATYSLPTDQTANGIVDTFVHTTEQYLTANLSSPLQDRLAESILLTLIEEAPKVFKNLHDYNTRANLMWCSTLALNGLIGAGAPQDWATHLIGMQITARCGINHAPTLAIILPRLLKSRRNQKREKLLKYAERIWNLHDKNEDLKILNAIDKTEQFFQSLGIKTYLSEYGIGAEIFPAIIANLKKNNQIAIGEDQGIDLKTIEAILEESL